MRRRSHGERIPVVPRLSPISRMAGVLLLIVSVSSTAPAQDFDGNGASDLAIGAPGEDVSIQQDSGSVSVIYGTSTGLTGARDEYWTQEALGLQSDPFDAFGVAITLGDFNGDGLSDLAVGAPDDEIAAAVQAGAVNVIYGSNGNGLTVVGNQYWHQDSPGMGGEAETFDHFGAALAVGDFDGDGYDDLAIGIPDEEVGAVEDAGGFIVLHGSADGLIAAAKVWNQGLATEEGDHYGETLAAGDFDNDGYDDLAVGAEHEDLGSVVNAGAVEIIYGSASGLSRRESNDFWHQDRPGIEDTAEQADRFGAALTTGDFNHDGFADLAVGVPSEGIGSPEVADAGAVNILYGSPAGISEVDSEFWHQDIGSIHSLAEAFDQFGTALTTGDFDADGYADLAVGVPYEDWNLNSTGIVQVLYGSSGGLSDIGNQLWRQDISGILDEEEAGDQFGFALATGDYNGDGYADLAIGVPYESILTFENAGLVHVLLGSSVGLTATGNQVWYQGGEGLLGEPETGDLFGWSLASDTRQVFPMFDDGFEAGDTSKWSSTVP